MTQELHNKVNQILKDYTNPQSWEIWNDTDWTKVFYKLLVEINNNA